MVVDDDVAPPARAGGGTTPQSATAAGAPRVNVAGLLFGLTLIGVGVGLIALGMRSALLLLRERALPTRTVADGSEGANDGGEGGKNGNGGEGDDEGDDAGGVRGKRSGLAARLKLKSNPYRRQPSDDSKMSLTREERLAEEQQAAAKDDALPIWLAEAGGAHDAGAEVHDDNAQRAAASAGGLVEQAGVQLMAVAAAPMPPAHAEGARADAQERLSASPRGLDLD
jgi:hypothetical protein